LPPNLGARAIDAVGAEGDAEVSQFIRLGAVCLSGALLPMKRIIVGHFTCHSSAHPK
jgi:hypothetical protein